MDNLSWGDMRLAELWSVLWWVYLVYLSSSSARLMSLV